MVSNLMNLTYEIIVQEGESFMLPEEAARQIKPGRWLLTIQPATTSNNSTRIRNHSGFLNGYSEADEGLYDDYSAR